MAVNVTIPATGSGDLTPLIAADEVTDGTLGTVKVQFVKLMDGTLNGTTKQIVGFGGVAFAAPSDGTTGAQQRVLPNNQAAVAQPTATVSIGFEQAQSDNTTTTAWITAKNGTAARSFLSSGICLLESGTDSAPAYAALSSNKVTRLIPSSYCQTRAVIGTNVMGTNVTSYIGAFNHLLGVPQNGFAIGVDGSGNLSVNGFSGGVSLFSITSAFNGQPGCVQTLVASTYYTFDVVYDQSSVLFYVNGLLLHQLVYFNYGNPVVINLPSSVSFVNGSSPTNRYFQISRLAAWRYGGANARGYSVYLTGSVTQLVKTGAGTVQKLLVGKQSAGTLTLYDNTTNSNILWTMTYSSGAPQALNLDLDFNVGLYVVTNADFELTVVFE